MARRSVADIEKIWSNVEGVKKLTDRIVGVGPFGIGLDGLLTWIPLVGSIYGLSTSGWLLVQAVRARASPGTLARMIAYLGLDGFINLTGEVPLVSIAPNLLDVVFRGHLLAVKALQKDIESTHWVEANEREARASGAHESHVAEMRRNPKLRRIAYLHD
ncbi:MAG: DUF4112 domain-containing protein [Brevundimonas sp.]|nr:DUF4112 domain-containing protein [Brevundimonas sp.]